MRRAATLRDKLHLLAEPETEPARDDRLRLLFLGHTAPTGAQLTVDTHALDLPGCRTTSCPTSGRYGAC
jgi:hypothetical protein